MNMPKEATRTARSSSHRRVGIFALASAVGLGVGLATSGTVAHANTCLDNGVCYYISSTGYPDFRQTVHLTGQPRVRDYVTYHYNVVIARGRQF
jgi:hypothetical protein